MWKRANEQEQVDAAANEMDIDEEIADFKAARENYINISGQILTYDVEPEGEEEPAKKARLTNLVELKTKLREVHPTITKGRPKQKGRTKDAA